MLENKALLDDPLPHLWCPAKAILQGWSLATTSSDHPNLIPTAGIDSSRPNKAHESALASMAKRHAGRRLNAARVTM